MARSVVLRFAFLIAAAWGTVPATSSMAADKVSVHMPSRGPESMPFLIADELGFYRDESIQFDGRVLQTGLGVMATVSGDIDVTQVLGLSLRGAIEQGAELKIVMLFNTLPSYSLLTHSRITSYEGLRGKKISTSASGASASEVLRIALQDNGLDPKKDVTFFYMGETPTRYQALVSGTVDASVLVSPFDVLAKDKGFNALPFANKPGVLMGGISASMKFLKNRPEVARRFLHATWKGLRYYKTNRTGSVEVMAKYMKVEPGIAGKIYDMWINRYSENGHEPADFIRQVLMFEFGKYRPEAEAQAFDFSIVRTFGSN
jgi:NitT/TauT family transport system substrate-binding protein